MLRSRRRKSGTGEDGAGWIYADLFLALMIVGLGSAVVTSSSPTAGAATTSAPPTFQLSCVEFSVKVPSTFTPAKGGTKIEAAVTQEISKRGWSGETAKPGLVIVFGGFSGGESAGDGDRRAQSLRAKLRASVPPFQHVEMRTGGAQTVTVNGTPSDVGGAGSFLLVVYLLFNGADLAEDCTR